MNETQAGVTEINESKSQQKENSPESGKTFYSSILYNFILGENPQKIDEIRKEIERIKEQQYLEKKKKWEEKEKKEVLIKWDFIS